MTTFRFRTAFLALPALCLAAFGQEARLTQGVNTAHPTLATGSAAPDFELPGIDGKTQSMTQAYGAQATPHIFIFDAQRKLRYDGRIDNAQRESLVKTQDARLALDAMLAGKPV